MVVELDVVGLGLGSVGLVVAGKVIVRGTAGVVRAVHALVLV